MIKTPTEWAKIFPDKNISSDNPIKKSAAELITDYSNFSIQDFKKLLSIDERVVHNINIELKQKNVVEHQKYMARRVEK